MALCFCTGRCLIPPYTCSGFLDVIYTSPSLTKPISPPSPPSTGWICPRCQIVHNPAVLKCHCNINNNNINMQGDGQV